VRKETDAERKTIRAFVAIYHLCEILYFSKEKEAPIAKEMVEWLNLTDKCELDDMLYMLMCLLGERSVNHCLS
jgi:hypothetical protein